jgi:PIN domain nuclease of toxin-antitoxin system
MTAVVADTHAIVWHFASSKKLSITASKALDQAIANRDAIYVSAITLVEITYLVEKNKLPNLALVELYQALDDPKSGIVIAPLDLYVAQAIDRIPRTAVPEMGDRIIAATALRLEIPLVTCDSRIQSLTVIQTIW